VTGPADNAAALPLLQRELCADNVALPLFEAAAVVAHRLFANGLRAFASPSGNALIDELATKAL
jgi:hypothetical protein